MLLRCSADPINVDLESVLQSRLCVNKMETQKHILWPGKIEAALQGQDSTAATGDTLMRNTETAFSPCWKFFLWVFTVWWIVNRTSGVVSTRKPNSMSNTQLKLVFYEKWMINDFCSSRCDCLRFEQSMCNVGKSVDKRWILYSGGFSIEEPIFPVKTLIYA